jgi:hypothetical protein
MHNDVLRHDKWDVDIGSCCRCWTTSVNGEVQHDTVDVTNVYYDTPDHDLQAHGIVLRRREGRDIEA